MLAHHDLVTLGIRHRDLQAKILHLESILVNDNLSNIHKVWIELA